MLQLQVHCRSSRSLVSWSDVVTQTLSKFTKKGNCDEQILALTSIDKFPNATVKDISLNVPSSDLPLSHHQWIDPHKDWTPEDFNRQAQDALAQNFGGDTQDSKPPSLDFSSVIPTTEEHKGLVAAKDNQYFSNLMNKMMDFASSKYALVNVNFKSDAFNDLYKSHREGFVACQKDIEDLRSRINDLLEKGKDRAGDIDKLNKQLAKLAEDLDALETQHKLNIGSANQGISNIDIEIDDLNRAIASQDQKARQRDGLQARVNDLKGRISTLDREVDDLTAKINKEKDDRSTNLARIKQLEDEEKDKEARSEHLNAEINVYAENEKLISLLSKLKEVILCYPV